MRDTETRRSAPNYTQACIVMFGVNLLWVLLTIWVIFGLWAVALTGWSVARLIDRIAESRP